MIPSETQVSAASLWTGWILSGLVALFLFVDAGMKLVPLQPVGQAMTDLGFVSTPGLARGLGILLLVCTALYVLRPTSVIGAILLTGYLGGTIAIQLRAGNPPFSHVLFGAYLGVMVWAGLLIRRPALREIILP